MENIFENAYFGKAYKTRDGRKAIYIYKEKISPFKHALSLGGVMNAMYEDDGSYDCSVHDADIVSEWQKEVDEKAPAYTYEQMATLNLQLQGLIDVKDDEFFKLREQCDYYKNKLILIEKILKDSYYI